MLGSGNLGPGQGSGQQIFFSIPPNCQAYGKNNPVPDTGNPGVTDIDFLYTSSFEKQKIPGNDVLPTIFIYSDCKNGFYSSLNPPGDGTDHTGKIGLLRMRQEMKIRKVLLVLVALIVAAIAGARLLPTSAATRVALGVFHVLDGAQLDDELGAMSLRVAVVLFSPNATVPQTRVFETALDEARRPNDLLIFNMSSYLAHRLPPADAKRLLVRRGAALRSGTCDRLYLVAALLPLAERGGLARSHVQDVIDGYAAVGRPMKPGDRDDERCRIYRAALDKLLANAQPRR